MVNGFLLIDGRELSVPVLPCSADAATPGYPALFPLRIGRLPDGAREEKTEVSICPDGSLVSAVRVYVLDGDGRGRRLTVGLWTATESFPPVLAWPEGFMIDPVEINGHRGLLVIPEEGTDSVASLRFWVKEHGYPNDPGAYVYISEETPGTAAAAELVDIGRALRYPDSKLPR